MQFTLKTYYRVEFLPVVATFVGETARCLGATEKEMFELNLAAEEAGLHIIEHYPGDGLDEQFEVVCEVCADGLQVVFQNMGLPVNLLALPKYEAAKAEETLDGLGLFLLEKSVDRLEFVNHGRTGWRTVMFKRLVNMNVPGLASDSVDDATERPQERLRAMRAGVEHVPGIVELVYRSYGYSYSKDVFYYADQLRDAMVDGHVQSFIALNPDGRVVGHMAILHTPGFGDIAEIGAVMVQPEYRRSIGLLQLIKLVNQTIKSSPETPALLEANLVTAHIISQKACALFHFKPMALKLSVHGRARFVSLAEDTEAQRESLLHAVMATRPMSPLRLFIPARHAEITRRLFANAETPLEEPGAAPDAPPRTTLKVSTHLDSALTVISVEESGQDFAAVMRQRLFDLESDGMKTVFVRFPGWLPHPVNLDDDARNLRIFFCGWAAEAPGRWWLLYTRLNAQRFDFNHIQLCDPLSVELKLYVENCFRAVML